MTDTPVLAQDLDAEESVLGALLLSSVAIDIVLGSELRSGDFYRGSHGTIFDAVFSLFADGEPVDAITISDRLDRDGKLVEVGGRGRVHELAALVPAVGNVGHYAQIVREMAMLRGLTTVGEQIQRLGWERPAAALELIERAQVLVYDLSHHATGDRGVVSLHDALGDTFSRIEEIYRDGREVVGVPTGFLWLDRLTTGLQPGNLIILAARPSMGKTALALGIAANVVVREQLPVALFTMEMNVGEVTQRLIASEGLVESQLLRTGKLGPEEWSQITAAAARLDQAPLLMDETASLTALELRSKARRLALRVPKLSLIIVDYLQLMTSGNRAENRNQDVSQISRTLKILAAELRVPVLALSQLSRQVEGRHDKRPMLSDLRESGSIEQDADLVMLLYRDDYYHEDDPDTSQRGIAEVNLAKHRNGPTGTVKLAFVERFAKFSDIA